MAPLAVARKCVAFIPRGAHKPAKEKGERNVTLSIGKAWEETSAFLGREAKLVAPVALATFALPAILAGWAFPMGGTGGGAGLLMVLVLLVALIGQMTVILLVNGWRGSIGQAMGTAARRLPALVAALVIVFLPIAIIATFAVGGSMFRAGITDPAALTPEMLAKMPAFLWGVLLFTILMIVLGVRMFPISAITVSEPAGPIALLKRSWRLTRGTFWRLLALVILLGLVAVVLDWAATAVVGSIAALVAGEPKPFNTSALLVALATGFVGALVSSVSAAMAGRVYAQLAAPETTVPNT